MDYFHNNIINIYIFFFILSQIPLMCYSTHQGKPLTELEKHFEAIAKLPEEMNPDDLVYHHANGFAHPPLCVLPQENPKYLAPLMWGLIPYWESGKDYKAYYKKTIKYGSGLNAKSEKLFSSTMYQDNALHRRCIVPVSGFFEPHTTPVKVNGKAFKAPFFFERKDKEIIKLAGIYGFTKDGYATFTILTKAATPLFSKIHNGKNRRPVILQDKAIDSWLDKSLQQADIENIIANDTADENINAYPISKDLYNPKIDSNRADITARVDYEQIAIKVP